MRFQLVIDLSERLICDDGAAFALPYDRAAFGKALGSPPAYGGGLTPNGCAFKNCHCAAFTLSGLWQLPNM